MFLEPVAFRTVRKQANLLISEELSFFYKQDSSSIYIDAGTKVHPHVPSPPTPIYIYVWVCVCVYICMYAYIYIG